jgi:polysaccharide pyruvyl transferase WcaK-like protein
MTPRAIILHGYSAANLGDGLLIDEAVRLIREALGASTDITILANHPASFEGSGLRVIDSGLSRRGYGRDYLSTLRRLGAYDLVVGVGGGYLRFGHPTEAAKAFLVHGPQLAAAAFLARSAVYLPQSIGPLRLGSRRPLRFLLRRVGAVMVRDDRSVAELDLPNVARYPDLAIALLAERAAGPRGRACSPVPVLSVRPVDGRIPEPVRTLATSLGEFDGYVQSTAGSNDDRAAMLSLAPGRVLSREELLADRTAQPRVVIAVRLHAALMALAAGHYVVHLAYERKGFAAFADLGLGDYVHNVRSFTPGAALEQARTLLTDAEARRSYDEAIAQALPAVLDRTRDIVPVLAGTSTGPVPVATR